MADGRLYLCATPIGNLADISARLAATLASVDLVYAEDTRRVAKLLAHLGVSVPTRSLFAGNEMARTGQLVDDVLAGRSVALVSDAGMPTISDPGATAVQRVRDAGRQIIAIPGPSAVTMSIALSGFEGDRFAFEGFLPRKGAERKDRLAVLAQEDRKVVVFISPHRLVPDLESIERVVGPDRLVTVNRELTKVHEEIWAGPIRGAIEYWSEHPPRGEITLVIAAGSPELPNLDEGVHLAASLVKSGISVSQAAREAAEATGLGRRDIYQRLVEAQEIS